MMSFFYNRLAFALRVHTMVFPYSWLRANNLYSHNPMITNCVLNFSLGCCPQSSVQARSGPPLPSSRSKLNKYR
jgi:hypothetical protein